MTAIIIPSFASRNSVLRPECFYYESSAADHYTVPCQSWWRNATELSNVFGASSTLFRLPRHHEALSFLLFVPFHLSCRHTKLLAFNGTDAGAWGDTRRFPQRPTAQHVLGDAAALTSVVIRNRKARERRNPQMISGGTNCCLPFCPRDPHVPSGVMGTDGARGDG